MTPDIRNFSPRALIIAPTTSVSRLLSARSAATHIKNKRAWEPSSILSFSAWVQRLWQQAPMLADIRRPLLLNPVQELAVWQEIVDESHWSQALLQTTSLARNASQANRMLAEWRIPLSRLKNFTNDETQALDSWIRAFDRRCLKQHWLPAYRVIDHLIVLPEEAISFPPDIDVYGFDEITPQQKSLLDCAVERGSNVRFVDPETRQGMSGRVALPDREREYDFAASWARDCLLEKKENSIAIALTDKGRQLDDLKRSLNRVFYPDSAYPSIVAEPKYDTGETAALNSIPIIDTALRILSQSHHRVDLLEFSAICRSAYLTGAEEEYFPRCRLDTNLRLLGELKPSLVFIASQIFDRENETYRVGCPQFHKQLLEWRSCIDELPANQSASEWAGDFARLLKSIGWPGSSRSDVSAQAILGRWDDVLSQLCALDAVTESMRREDALSWLRRLAAEAPTPGTRTVRPIHILSIEDASRLSFDRLWVCGLDDELWPPASRPNPLIPIALQREFGIPGSSNSLVTTMARRTLEKVMQNSGEVILSYATRKDDRELGISSLVAGIDEISVSALPVVQTSTAENLLASRLLENHQDLPVPLKSNQARGGTSILKNQAACPFRAFVTHRLVSEIPEEPQPGLDAAERGTLIHKVMEIVWSRLISHSGLVEADETEREHIVLDAARTALDQFTQKKPDTLTPRFREIELERLVTLVMQWLHFEETRHSFTVLHPEAERVVELGGLQMKVFIDRIDQNEIGEHIILDYKTGKPRVSNWFGERPDEPQLPLYAVSEKQAGNNVAAICYAQIRSAEMSFNGISQEKDQVPGTSLWSKQKDAKQFDSWDALLDSWRSKLEKLADDFVAGIAPVDPKTAFTCEYCDLPGACRINELKHRLGLADIEESEDDE
jgi:ATP-dependent helicase/nuclease subunit B